MADVTVIVPQGTAYDQSIPYTVGDSVWLSGKQVGVVKEITLAVPTPDKEGYTRNLMTLDVDQATAKLLKQPAPARPSVLIKKET